MFAKALYVSIQQTLRSVALTFFPSTFISLVIWATAGSASRNTSDPLRGSLWLWLGLHLEHFKLLFSAGHYGALTYLPMGAAIFPLLSLRSGIKRLRLFGEANALHISIFFLSYIGVMYLAALVSQTDGISPDLKYLPLSALPLFLIAWLTTMEKNPPIWRWAKSQLAIVVAIAGCASIIYGVALFTHIELVKSLAVVIQPGWVGGVTVLVLQILYIPNIIIAEISYSLGFGFSLGAHTHLAPLWFSLHQIPSLQVLGGLPTGTHPMIIYTIAGYVVIFAAYQISLRRTNPKLASRIKIVFLTTLIISLMFLGVSYLAGGQLLTTQLNPVGIRYWPIAASYAALSFALLFIVIIIPAAISQFIHVRQERKLMQVRYE